MKKFITGLAAITNIIVFVQFAMANNYRYGMTPVQLQEKFSDFGYEVQAGSRTISAKKELSANATFYGYATDWSIKLATGDTNNSSAQIWVTDGASNTVKVTTITFIAGDNTYQTNFIVPLDSPTYINIQLVGQTTVFYTIGGYKRDNPNP